MLKFLILVAVVAGAQAQINWCDEQNKWCDAGDHHIACEPNGFPYGTNVSNIKMVTMTADIQALIVKTHNDLRSKVAKGTESGLPAAQDMFKMRWDDNLAFVASKHAEKAKFAHDDCRAFTAYPRSGQNLAMGMSSAPFSSASISATIQSQVSVWYTDEVQYVRDLPGCIDQFTMDCMAAGHITALLHGDSEAVGCAAVTYDQFRNGRKWYVFQTTCNYDETNMLDDIVYTAGTASTICSKCSAFQRTCDTATGLCV
uniref:Putative scp-like extracellular protein n=1 Tax=Nyssomyia neivai TaxID=330878 RepID=A0A1L8DQY2_9DIPT